MLLHLEQKRRQARTTDPREAKAKSKAQQPEEKQCSKAAPPPISGTPGVPNFGNAFQIDLSESEAFQFG